MTIKTKEVDLLRVKPMGSSGVFVQIQLRPTSNFAGVVAVTVDAKLFLDGLGMFLSSARKTVSAQIRASGRSIWQRVPGLRAR